MINIKKNEKIDRIWTGKAVKVIEKKIKGESLSQQDSNYLSRFVRPKLRGMSMIDAGKLLKKLEYNPCARWIEKKIKKLILGKINGVDSIIVCGSAIQTNYEEYNDIDVIVATKKVLDLGMKEKEGIVKDLTESAKKEGLNLDIQLYSKKSIISQYPHNPSLIYQLKDSKVIYGDLKIPKKIELSNLDLKMKLDWSEGLDKGSSGSEIYYAIRNAVLVLLLMNGKVDNNQLRENLVNSLGRELIGCLKSNEVGEGGKN